MQARRFGEAGVTGNSDGDALFVWRFGNAQFDQAAMRLKVGGKPRKLELKPAQVLELLLCHAGEVVTREELMDTVWEGRVVVENVLSTAIGKLREALADVDAVDIETVPRAGYRLVGSIERNVSRQRASSDLELATGQPVPGREDFKLSRRLGESAGGEVWLARRTDGGKRVFKFAADGRRPAAGFAQARGDAESAAAQDARRRLRRGANRRLEFRRGAVFHRKRVRR